MRVCARLCGSASATGDGWSVERQVRVRLADDCVKEKGWAPATGQHSLQRVPVVTLCLNEAIDAHYNNCGISTAGHRHRPGILRKGRHTHT